MCLFTTECTSMGLHCNRLFRTNKRTPYGWSWMPGLCIILISVHKICIADGLPWMPDPYRDPRTQNRWHRRHTVRIATGHRISVTILGDYCCGCSRYCSGTSASLPLGSPVQWQWIIFGLCPYVVTGAGYRLSVPNHTTPYHTKGGWISPDGCASVTVSRPTAVGLAISHRCRLERKSRRWRGK